MALNFDKDKTLSFVKQKSKALWFDSSHIYERYVIVFGLIFGLLFAFLIAPMQGADEPNHFMRAYQISKLDIVSQKVGDSTGGINPELRYYSLNVGGELPAGIVNLAQASYDMHGEPNVKMTRIKFGKLKNIETGSLKKAAAFPNTAAYSPVAYAPSVVGIWTGQILRQRPLVMMYLARIAGVIFGVLVLAAATRLMPFGKLPFAVIALLPMTLGQLAVVSADTMAIALSFFAIALTLYYSFRKKDLSKFDWLAIAATCSLLALNKQALLPLTLLTLCLLINKAIPRKKALWVAGSSIALAVVLGLIWNGIVKEMVIFGYHQTYLQADYYKQLHMLPEHPGRYFKVMYEAFFTTKFNVVLFSIIGTFGWLDTFLPLAAIIGGFVLIALSIFISSQHENISLPKWFRPLLILAGIGVIWTTALLLFLLTMSPTHGYNLGLQGRYLIPALLIIALGLAIGNKKRFTTPDYYKLGRRCLNFSVLLLTIMTVVVALRYY